LAHADKTGGVDYRFAKTDGLDGAAEVTTVTSEDVKRANAAWMKVREREYEATLLQASWHVVVHQDRVVYNGLEEDVERALAAFEAAGVETYREWEWMQLVDKHQTVREAIGILASRAVSAAETMRTKDPALRRVFIAPMAGYTARGSDHALELIERELVRKPDSVQKLLDARVHEAHLFIWLDSDTPGAIARPFIGGTAVEWEHFGLPTREPDAPLGIHALWVMHTGTGLGWLWRRGSGWSAVQE
jgi:hypothetical protein